MIKLKTGMAKTFYKFIRSSSCDCDVCPLNRRNRGIYVLQNENLKDLDCHRYLEAALIKEIPRNCQDVKNFTRTNINSFSEVKKENRI